VFAWIGLLHIPLGEALLQSLTDRHKIVNR
jgi:hypothetical protein